MVFGLVTQLGVELVVVSKVTMVGVTTQPLGLHVTVGRGIVVSAGHVFGGLLAKMCTGLVIVLEDRVMPVMVQ
jgi:hypothetical protein